jgi:hypothetical protein
MTMTGKGVLYAIAARKRYLEETSGNISRC